VLALASTARAEDAGPNDFPGTTPWVDLQAQEANGAVVVEPLPLVELRVEGDTKVTVTTALRLVRLSIGDPITSAMRPQLEQALLTSNLFKSAKVRLEVVQGGVVLVVTLDDKLSWIVAPTLYLLPSSWSFGAGFAENNLFGAEKKLLLYGQVGNQTSLFFGTYFDPAVRGTKLQLRFDVYLLHRSILEFKNPQGDATDYTIDRNTKWNFLDVGILAGWRWFWWLIGDVRFKPAYAFFTKLETDDPANRVKPDKDGWDVTLQGRITIDRRKNRHGVTWGPYLQLITDVSVPGLDDYGYQVFAGRAYYSWKFFDEHQLELRVSGGIGRHLPVHEELVLGGVSDVRGYIADQFRGDRRGMARAEYSVPMFKWNMFAFRALGFFDAGYIGYHWRDPDSRNYLPTQYDGASWTRTDVGAGFRIYVKSVVLPLLGLDIARGIEGKRTEVVFEVGITDF
jgi:outer membrane protein assembly factor BamA